jgi:hypothetical protein
MSGETDRASRHPRQLLALRRRTGRARTVGMRRAAVLGAVTVAAAVVPLPAAGMAGTGPSQARLPAGHRQEPEVRP